MALQQLALAERLARAIRQGRSGGGGGAVAAEAAAPTPAKGRGKKAAKERWVRGFIPSRSSSSLSMANCTLGNVATDDMPASLPS